jgi:hypothetical protein
MKRPITGQVDGCRLKRKPGKIVRVDHKRGMALVSVGIGQWEVTLEEVLEGLRNDYVVCWG